MLDQRIGRHRRAVAEIADLARFRGDLDERFCNPCCDGVGGIGGGRGDLPNRDPAALFLEQADVGKCATGVDADAPCHWSNSRCCRCVGALGSRAALSIWPPSPLGLGCEISLRRLVTGGTAWILT